jgi:hypothetical protein
MPRTFTLTTPFQTGSFEAPITVTSLQITEVYYSSTPALAPIGTGTLNITLTDPATGWQYQAKYQDASVLTLWQTIADPIAQSIFAKLIADGKLPPGTLAPTQPLAQVTTQ